MLSLFTKVIEKLIIPVAHRKQHTILINYYTRSETDNVQIIVFICLFLEKFNER